MAHQTDPMPDPLDLDVILAGLTDKYPGLRFHILCIDQPGGRVRLATTIADDPEVVADDLRVTHAVLQQSPDADYQPTVPHG